MITKLTFADFYTIVWSMVPQVWKDADDEYGKSLQILLYTMSQHMYYYFYDKIVHMEELFDPDRCPEKYLKFLSGMVGWNLIGADPDSWREQIKAAPLLYKVRGTKRGLLLAEKLIGYSVFMSELYRDHVGDAVSKERIFNNTPSSIKQKPWFRNTLVSVEGELLGGVAESDQFDSFNRTPFVKLDAFGNVIRPRLVSNKRTLTFTQSSTTSLYNNISGANSLARYAKLPRINVVLKYDHDLGEELPSGDIRQNNFTGALDLLLQFKPFHVYINNLEVRYSLSEYVFDETNINSELLSVHEALLAAVNINMSRAENTITFSKNPAVEFSEAIKETPASPLENRGVISSIYRIINLNELIPTPVLYKSDLDNKSMLVKALNANSNDLPTTSDVHQVLRYDLSRYLDNPILDFKAMYSSQQEETIPNYSTTSTPNYNKVILSNYGIGLDSSVIANITIEPQLYRSSVLTTLGSQNIDLTPSKPWDLQNIDRFFTNVINLNPNFTALEVFKYIYDNTLLVVLQRPNGMGTRGEVLDPVLDYYFDNNNDIFLNSATIGNKFGETNAAFLSDPNSILHILYLTRITYNNETELGIQSRGFRYKTRVNSKFSRQFLVNSLPQDSINRLMPTQIVSIDSKTKQKTIIGTKKFKESINIYNRSSLKNDVIDGYTIVNKDPLNRIDQSKWTVYSPEYSDIYLGDQKITNNWWGNYYQAQFPDISLNMPAFVPYIQVDKSEEAQLKNTYSNQWLAALRYLNLSDPKHFLVTRKADSNRAGIWKRNSCKFVSIPFIRSRRDALQVFRRDNPTFTRFEESTDYPADTSVPFRLDNYKYILPDNTDVSLSYFTPGFSEIANVSVTTEATLGQKAILTSSGYNLIFPASDSYYNTVSSNLDITTYFSYNAANEPVIKSSLYAGNIPISRDPSKFTGITDGLDKLNLLITGLEVFKETFIVKPQVTNFILSKRDLFVTWSEINTGEGVSFGFYEPPGIVCNPNIIVTLNGAVQRYGTSWTIIFDRLKTLVFKDTTELNTGDVITIEYQIIPGELPAYILPEPQISHIIEYILTSGDIITINKGNRYIFDLPTVIHPPGIAWYSNITSEFISYGSIPEQYQPFALYSEAEPNVILKVNGFIVKYKSDWVFLLKNLAGVVIASVALSPSLSLTLSPNDTISFEYLSTT